MGHFAAARGDINLAVISGQVNFGGANSPAAESPVTVSNLGERCPEKPFYRGQISSKEHNQ
jgi:hypothetical protein